MAALHNVQLIAIVYNRAAVVVFSRYLCQCCQHIQLCHCIGRALDAVQLAANGFQQLTEQPVLQRNQPLVGAQNFTFQFLELLRDVPLAAGEGLFADIRFRHHALIRVAHLNKVAKHMVIADLQLGDAGFLPQAGLQLGQDALGIIPDGTQLVHFRVVTLGNDTAILEGRGGFRVHGCINFLLDIVQCINLCGQLCQLRTVAALRLLLEARQAVTGLRHRVDLFWGSRAIDRAGHQALQVRNIVQLFDQIATLHRLMHQTLHRIQAAVDSRTGHQRLLDPAAEHPFAHGSAGFIQHPKQCSPLFTAAQRLRQFEICPGDRGKTHKLCLIVADDGFQTLHAFDLGIMEIFQQCRHGKANQTVRGNARLRRPITAKLIFQCNGDKTRCVALLFHQFHGAGHIFLDVVCDLPAVQQPRVHQYFARVITAELRNNSRGNFALLELGDVGRTGRNIRKAEARRTIFEEDAGNVVVAVVLQHTALNDRSRCNHPDNITFDKTFCLGRVFHLLTDGDFVTLGNEAGHIALIAVEWHAAHGGTLFQTALLARQGQVQLFGGCQCIVKKHLVKIADAVKKNLVFVLLFDFKVLLHHGRKLRHGRSPSSPFSALPAAISPGLWAKTAFCKQNAACKAQPRF